MSINWISKCLEVFKKYPNLSNERFSYGTAGFRTLSENMPFVCSRISIVAILRAIHTNSAIGVMLTASHNPYTDNGVKIIDPDGSMLDHSWESIATEFVNCPYESLDIVLNKILKHEFDTYELEGCKTPKAAILIGYDTRKNNDQLALEINDICIDFKVICKIFRYLTTPQLHYITKIENSNVDAINDENGYYKKFGSAYIKAINRTDKVICSVVDAANGIGGPQLHKMMNYLASRNIKNNIDIINNKGMSNESYESLNHNCGSDFIKSNNSIPDGFDTSKNSDHCVSFDGDADRIIYFIVDGSDVKLLDGDRIGVLCAMYIQDLLSKLTSFKLNFGVVQTAYSNGNCTDYLRRVLNVPVVITDTGVKNLHREAKKFDIGVYFEANGHGTVLFSESTIEKLRVLAENTNDENCQVYNSLLDLSELINQTVGDAITTFLAVECILSYFDMNCVQWHNLYDNLPNELSKWTNQSKGEELVIQGAECRCIKPVKLANQIDDMLCKHKSFKARAFVRQSGTEKSIRIYVEATDTKIVRDLSQNIINLLEKSL